MTEREAIELARDYLREQIDIAVHRGNLEGLAAYGFDAATEYLVNFGLYEQTHVGSSNYLAVCKRNGAVRYLGRLGE